MLVYLCATVAAGGRRSLSSTAVLLRNMGIVLLQLVASTDVATPGWHAGASSLAIFSCPNSAVRLVIEAVKANYTTSRRDQQFWLLFYHTVIKVLKWIVSHSVMLDSMEVSHGSAADCSKIGADHSDAAKSPVSSEQADGCSLGKTGEDGVGKGGSLVVRESSSSSDRANTTVAPPGTGALTVPVLEAVLDFWLVLAARLSAGLPAAAAASPRWGMSTMELSEKKLLEDVMSTIRALVTAQPVLLDGMLFGSSIKHVVHQLFLSPANESVRESMRQLLCVCVSAASPAAQLHLLKVRIFQGPCTVPWHDLIRRHVGSTIDSA
jgi:hypothetical protein